MAAGPRISIVGAGVIGLSTALRLCREVPDCQVTVLADSFLADTTSNGAAGLWEPYKLGSTPIELANAWAEETFHHLRVSLLHALDPCTAPPSVLTDHFPQPLSMLDYHLAKLACPSRSERTRCHDHCAAGISIIVHRHLANGHGCFGNHMCKCMCQIGWAKICASS